MRSDFRIFMPDEHGQLFDDPDETFVVPTTRAPATDGRNRRRDNATPGVPQKRKRRDKDKEASKDKGSSGLKVSSY